MTGFARDGAVYLDVNPVELIKAHPRTPLRQPPEEFPHHLVVDLVRAVEHHAQDADSLGEFGIERSTIREEDVKGEKRRLRGDGARDGRARGDTTTGR